MILAHVEVGIWIVAGTTLLASFVAAGGAIVAALIARENRRKLTTPGEGTIGKQVQEITDR